MSEFRQDRTNGRWTIIAPERGGRPHDQTGGDAPEMQRAAFDPACPFCPGNEDMLPAIIEEASCERSPGWCARVVPNKYPIVTTDEEGRAGLPGDRAGVHQVIIETPRHDADLDQLPPENMRVVVDTWHRRFAGALALPGIEAAVLFRNRGNDAGASLGHAHSQLVALPLVPPRLESSLAWARAYHEEHLRCAVCEELRQEIETGERVVELTEEFAVLVPFAAAGPLEQRIVPRAHQPSFALADEASRAKLGIVLQRAILRMKSVANHPAYNLLVEPGSTHPDHADSAHWAIRILPHLTTPGGFELLSGISVNPSSPEHDAASLRES